MAGNTPIKLIVGLGNPGYKYTVTRHNAGFWFIDQLARRHQTSFRTETKFKAVVASFEHEGKRVWLVKPTTFMNLSGECVGPFAKYYQIAPENTLVVHDELDLSVGTSRYKWAGGHGGHNGIRDIFNHFGKDFWRLRVGVGHPGSKEQVLSFVMKAPSSKEQSLIDDSLERVFDTLPDVLTGDMEAAMRSLHKKPDE